MKISKKSLPKWWLAEVELYLNDAEFIYGIKQPEKVRYDEKKKRLLDKEFIAEINQLEKVKYDEKQKLLMINEAISEKEKTEFLFLISLYRQEEPLLRLLNEFELHLGRKKRTGSLCQKGEKTVTVHQFEKAGFNFWGDIFGKLTKNGWAKAIQSMDEVRLTADLHREKDRMLKIFGDDFPKIFPILQQAQEWHLLKGKSVFSGLFSPRFWLEWIMEYQTVDKRGDIIDRPMYYQLLINGVIERKILKYVLEVGDINSASWFYDADIMSDKKKAPIEPLYSVDFDYILNKAKDTCLAQGSVIKENGINIKFLKTKAYGPIDDPYLGLWKIRMDSIRRTIVEDYQPILSNIDKIRTSLIENNAIAEAADAQSQVSESKASPQIDFYLGGQIDQVVIFPEKIREKIKETIKGSYYKNKDYQIYALLRYWLEFCFDKQDIHWLGGFIAFSSWREGEEVKDHLKAFGQCITVLKTLGKDTNLWVIKERTRRHRDKYLKGHWIFDKDKITFFSNILKAKKICNEAKECEDISEKRIKLAKAREIYPDYLEIHILLVESWERDKFKDINLEEIKRERRFFVEKKDIYEKACNVSFKLQLKGNTSYWYHNETSKLMDELLERFYRIEHFAIVLIKWCKDQKNLSEEEERYERIKDFIGHKNHDFLLKSETVIKKAIGNVLNQLGWQEIEYDSEADLIGALREAYKMGRDAINEKKEVISQVYNAFIDLIIKEEININYLEAGDLNGFKNYLTDTILKKIRQQKGEDHPFKEISAGVDPEKIKKYPPKKSPKNPL